MMEIGHRVEQQLRLILARRGEQHGRPRPVHRFEHGQQGDDGRFARMPRAIEQ
jgi:hypothetical protein